MKIVNEELYFKEIEKHSLLKKASEIIENSREVKALLKQANIMSVNRLFYNDHGITHSRIVSGTSILIFDFLLKNNIFPSILNDNEGTIEDARLATFLGAYFHDIGNAIHREMHNVLGLIVLNNILDHVLSNFYVDERKIFIKNEVLNIVFSHLENIEPLTLESEIVRLADGLDMSEGRARIPYRLGKSDIHAFSALAIEKVTIEEKMPLKINVYMKNEAGIFQIEEVLLKKLEKCKIIKNYIEISAIINEKEIKKYFKNF